MPKSLTPQPDATPLDAASQIASFLGLEGACEIDIWDAARFAEYGECSTVECAAIRATGWDDWTMDVWVEFRDVFPGLLLQSITASVLGIYVDAPVIFPPHMRRKDI